MPSGPFLNLTILSWLGFVVVALPHYKLGMYIAWPAAILSVGLLVFLLIPGVPTFLVEPVNGARAWIKFPLLNLQPSEPAKIAYVLFMALYLRRRDPPETLLALIPPGLLTLIPVGLITVQPDLGTASLFVPSLFGMLVTAGARLRYLALVVVMAALAAPIAWPFLLPHQKARFEALVQQVQGDRSREHGATDRGAAGHESAATQRREHGHGSEPTDAPRDGGRGVRPRLHGASGIPTRYRDRS